MPEEMTVADFQKQYGGGQPTEEMSIEEFSRHYPDIGYKPMTIGEKVVEAGKQLLSPITGLASIPRQLMDYANRRGPVFQPHITEGNPLAEAEGNALLAGASIPGAPQAAWQAARAVPRTLKGAATGAYEGLGQKSVGGAAAGSAIGYVAGGPHGAAVGGSIGGALPSVEGAIRGGIRGWRNESNVTPTPPGKGTGTKYGGAMPVGQQDPGTILPRGRFTPPPEEPPANPEPWQGFQTSPRTSKLLGRRSSGSTTSGWTTGKIPPRRGLDPDFPEVPKTQATENTGVPKTVLSTVLDTPAKLKAAKTHAKTAGSKKGEPVVIPGSDTSRLAETSKAVNGWNKYIAGTESKGVKAPRITVDEFNKLPRDKQLELIDRIAEAKANPDVEFALGGVVDTAPAQKAKVHKSKRGILYGPPKELRRLKKVK